MDFKTILFRRPTKRWPNHQLNFIYTEASLEVIFTSASWYKQLQYSKVKQYIFFYITTRQEIKQALYSFYTISALF